jgi:nitrogen-specific signal transduction histidine kinase
MTVPARLLDALPQGAALLDDRGAIVATNAEFERLAGKDGRSLRGTDLFDALGSIPEVLSARGLYRSGSAPVLLDVATRSFGAVAGDHRVRLASFGEGPDRGALVLVEEVPGRSCDAMFETVSHARHEINNSLMGIIGHVELLLAEPDLPNGVRRRAEAINKESQKIRDRVADLASVRKT